jgi:hypothetical protein
MESVTQYCSFQSRGYFHKTKWPFWFNWVIGWVNSDLKTWYTFVNFSLGNLTKRKWFSYHLLIIWMSFFFLGSTGVWTGPHAC